MNVKLKVLVFGNRLVKEDSLPIRLLPRLRKEFLKIEFLEIDSTENLQDEVDEDRGLLVLDSVMGIDSVKVLDLSTEEDFKKLETPGSFSMHDFDLAYNLRLLKKVRLINGVKVICVPMDGFEDEIFDQLQSTFKKCVAQLIQGS
jgi:Ni,Fe-hydrogenase maturation factor